jgi:hypothetical protein
MDAGKGGHLRPESARAGNPPMRVPAVTLLICKKRRLEVIPSPSRNPTL